MNFFIAGEQGMWLASAGDIILDALAHMWYRARVDREFNSLIKFGETKVSIRFWTEQVYGSSTTYDFGVGVGKTWLKKAMNEVREGSILIHNFERWKEAFPTLEDDMQAKNITLLYIPTRELIHKMNLHHMFENTFVIWAIAHVLWISHETIESALHARYGKKEKLRKANQWCLKRWYDTIKKALFTLSPLVKGGAGGINKILLDGNTALALWALHAWMRCYYAYPMSPSTSILSYLAKTADKTWITIKQAEDEITAVQLTIWSMYAWARAMTATSWWWFDLMTETISLSGITEVPLVCTIVQRPGPGTWLPTRTAQWDLLLAVYSWHGEFARIVIAVSDQLSAYELTQHAFNLAEQFQVPVILLSEKVIAESRRMIPEFKQGTIPVIRNLVTDPQELKDLQSTDRYKLTESWVSKRRLPGTSETIFFCNGDEHKEDGTLDESVESAHMIMKRIKKKKAILEILPEPVTYGNPEASISFVWWGSTKNAVLDCINNWADINYLHYDYVFPLKTQQLKQFITDNSHVCIIENNATGQLQQLIQKEWITIEHTFFKWNGRQFYVEDILEYIEKQKIG